MAWGSGALRCGGRAWRGLPRSVAESLRAIVPVYLLRRQHGPLAALCVLALTQRTLSLPLH